MNTRPVWAFVWIAGLLATPRLPADDDVPNGDYGGYHTWPEILAKMDAFQAAHPDLVYRTSLGKTLEGRDIPLYRISDHAAQDEDEPEILLQCGIHPREQPPQVCMMRFLEEEIFGKYGKDDRITKIVDGREIWFIPIFNVDGKVYDMRHGNGKDHGAEWRKNRRPNADGTYGIDLNRQFLIRWGASYERGVRREVAIRPKSDYYEGTGPLTEPEAQALARFLGEHPLRAFVDIHSPFKAIFFPDYLSRSEYGRYAGLARGMRGLQKDPYKLTNAFSGEEPPFRRGGDTAVTYDYGYYVDGIYSFVFEIFADPKWYPPMAQIDAEYERNFREPMLYLLEHCADLPLRKEGTAKLVDQKLEGKLSPGAAAEWKPKLEGPCEYAVLASEGTEIRVTSEFRLGPIKKGFRVEVIPGAKPGTGVPMKLYVWDADRGRTVIPFSLKIE